MNEDFIGDRICDLRIKAKNSARDMSLNLGQGVNYINLIENHKCFPSMPAFLNICDYLGISPKEFFDEENVNPKLINDINVKLRKLTNKQLTKIYELIESFTGK